MKKILKKKVTRKQFLKAGLGLLVGILISYGLTKIKVNNKNDSYGNNTYGGSR